MNRLQNLDQSRIDFHRGVAQQNYPDYAKPCPGTYLKVDDDVQWLGFVDGRVLWGHDEPQYFFLYAPDIFGDVAVPVDVGYVNDRAPADPQESPLPIFEPSPQYAQQPGARDAQKSKGKTKTADASEARRVLQETLKKLPKENAKQAREYIRTHRADIALPDDEG